MIDPYDTTAVLYVLFVLIAGLLIAAKLYDYFTDPFSTHLEGDDEDYYED